MAVAPLRKLFTVAEFQAMGRSGVLTEDDRLELVEGEIYEMSPIGPWHMACVNWLNLLFSSLAAAKRAIVSIQNPLPLGQRSEPQPDVALLRYREGFYRTAPPAVADVLLVVEVADSSADYDRRVKGALYAESGITEFWLIDLPAKRVEIYRQPGAEGYGEVRRVSRGERFSPLAFPDLVVEVSELLG
jgi:Uma2 family endonuclease